jgi:hypothetical protein
MEIENLAAKLREQQSSLAPDFFDKRIRRKYWQEKNRYMDRRKAAVLVIAVLLLDLGLLLVNQLREENNADRSRFYELYVPGNF